MANSRAFPVSVPSYYQGQLSRRGAEDCHSSPVSLWVGLDWSVVGGVEQGWNARLPGPRYLGVDGVLESAGRMETDFVIRAGNRLIIADAKYYRAHSVRSSPGWSDIVKQIYYVEALKTVVKDETDVSTCFIFPAATMSDGPMREVAMYAVSGPREVRFPPIACHYIKTGSVLKAYVDGTSIAPLATGTMHTPPERV